MLNLKSIARSVVRLSIIALVLAQSDVATKASFPGANGKITFLNVTPGLPQARIDVVNADGTGVATIPNTPPGAYFFDWSPDGQRLVLAGPELSVMNADFTGYTPLPAAGYEPSWSPDGTHIAWQYLCDIWVMLADGTSQQNLTQTGDCTTLPTQDFHPKWTPDGSRITFESYRFGLLEILSMNTDGSDVTNLTQNASNDYMHDWSPDGTKLVFGSDRDAGAAPGEIYVMNADGTNQTRLTFTPDAYESHPIWSPDGTRIAFASTRDGGFYDIYSMNPDGSNVQLVIKTHTVSMDWQPLDPSTIDSDSDGITDSGDNCPHNANAAQTNTDGDAFGDACDPDDDNDGFLDAADSCPAVSGTVNGCPVPRPLLTLSISPPHALVNTLTTVIFTVRMDPRSPMPTIVELQRVDSNGAVVEVVGRMYDDGNNGDARSNDKQFTYRANLVEPAVTRKYFRVITFRDRKPVSLSTVTVFDVIPSGVIVIG